jgi:hypothetical protein
MPINRPLPPECAPAASPTGRHLDGIPLAVAFTATILLASSLGVPVRAQPAAGQPGAGGIRMARPGGEPLLVTLLQSLSEGTPGLIQLWDGDPNEGAQVMNALEFVAGDGDATPRIALPNGTTIRFRPFDANPEAGGTAPFAVELVLGSGEEERFLEVVRALGASAAYVVVDVLVLGVGPGGIIRGPASGQ